jgi:hypothetical protein
MLLYHGTSEWAAVLAADKGIQPRREHGMDNWEHTVSGNPDAVYLTNTYACHFAINAMLNAPRVPDLKTVLRKRIAVIEIETRNLVRGKLHPDEDAMEQFNRGKDDYPFDLKRRTEIYRALVRKSPDWRLSLDVLGTCAYYGPIAPRHITRIAYFKPKANPFMMRAMMDGVVSTAAFKYAGYVHKNCIKWLFGEPVKPRDIDGTMLEEWPEGTDPEFVKLIRERSDGFKQALADRSGIELMEIKR